jgi:hypothetical protein
MSAGHRCKNHTVFQAYRDDRYRDALPASGQAADIQVSSPSDSYSALWKALHKADYA